MTHIFYSQNLGLESLDLEPSFDLDHYLLVTKSYPTNNKTQDKKVRCQLITLELKGIQR